MYERMRITNTGNINLTNLNSGPLAGFRNRIINGAFDIWQRGTSFSSTGYYTADRWEFECINAAYSAGVAGAVTKNSDNSLRISSVGTDSGFIQLAQPMELRQSDVGSTMTFSVRVKKISGATFGGSAVLRCYMRSDSATIRDGTLVATLSTVAAMSTSYVTYSCSFTVPAFTGYLAIGPYFYGVNNTQATTPLFDIQYVQVEPGSVATPFESRPIQTELALCQRYYYRISGDQIVAGMSYSTVTNSIARVLVNFPVIMRIIPSALEQSGTASNYNILFGVTATPCTSVPTHVGSSTANSTLAFTATSGHTVGQSGIGYLTTSNAYLGWSAEF
jgi:hypothetical protein